MHRMQIFCKNLIQVNDENKIVSTHPLELFSKFHWEWIRVGSLKDQVLIKSGDLLYSLKNEGIYEVLRIGFPDKAMENA
jgi:hypothetical protein